MHITKAAKYTADYRTRMGKQILCEMQKAYQRKVRDKLFEILGGAKCIRCGFTDKRALQFDHINGGGNVESKMRFDRHCDRMRAYYVRNPEEAKQKLQVLCANCNWIKKYENKENAGCIY